MTHAVLWWVFLNSEDLEVSLLLLLMPPPHLEEEGRQHGSLYSSQSSSFRSASFSGQLRASYHLVACCQWKVGDPWWGGHRIIDSKDIGEWRGPRLYLVQLLHFMYEYIGGGWGTQRHKMICPISYTESVQSQDQNSGLLRASEHILHCMHCLLHHDLLSSSVLSSAYF